MAVGGKMPIFSEIQNENELIEGINYYFYSRPMSVVNFKRLQIPLPQPLRKLISEDKQYIFHIRSSHGLLHVLAAAELVGQIDEIYIQYVEGYTAALDEIAQIFRISQDYLLDLVRIAVLLHDSGREGDGIDLWDAKSADNCRNYLIQMNIRADLAALIADTIRHKDDPKEFQRKYQHIHPKIDFLRHLVNMADTLEVIRTRDIFKPEYMPVANLINEKIMVQQVIPRLVVPHRQLIIEQGRLAKNGEIEFDGNRYQFDDSAYSSQPGTDSQLMFTAYLEKVQRFNLSVLEINQRNLPSVLQRAIRGIETYLNEHRNPGVQFFHNGCFSPRYHSPVELSRARFYRSILKSIEQPNTEKIKALCALFVSKEGNTLKEAVSRSFNQGNEETIRMQLYALIQPDRDEQDVINGVNQDIERYICRANGIR